MNKLYNFMWAVVLTCFPLAAINAQLTLTPVITGLNAPMEIVPSPDGTGRMFIVERAGTIKILSGTTLLPGNFLDFSSLVSTVGERGFLSMAFHPNYAANRYFFVLYNNGAGDLVLSRYRADSLDPNQALSASGTLLMAIPHPTNTNHNGGKLAFGTDGNLFWSTGDGGGSNDPPNNAQNGNVLLGKMLRINVDSFDTAPYYTIPASNPFVGDPAVADEIWNIGLRNPFRWSFDRLNGDMWIADVGQGAYEEVDHSTLAASSGLNYGWRCREGAHAYITGGCAPTGYTDPVFEYDHSVGSSITGGYIYRGSAASLYGKYICIDFVSGNAFIVTPGVTAPYAFVMQSSLQTGITGFGEDATGELYATSIGGTLYAVSATAIPLPVEMISFGYRNTNSCYTLQWKAVEKNISYYEIERSADGKAYVTIGRQDALNHAQENNYEFPLCKLPAQEGYYRLRIHASGSDASYSKVLHISGKSKGDMISVFPTVVNDVLHIKSEIAWERIVCTDLSGRIVKELQQQTPAGYATADVSALVSGTYFAHITGNNGNVSTHRFIVSR